MKTEALEFCYFWRISVNQTDIVWTRITCGGSQGGGYPPPHDPHGSVYLNTPTRVLNGQNFRFFAHGRENGNAICAQLGYRFAVNVHSWQYARTEEWYLNNPGYFIRPFDQFNFDYVIARNHPYHWSQIICAR